VSSEAHTTIASEHDIISARQRGRELAAELGFSKTDLALIATAISELARNILTYAQRGAITTRTVEDNGRRGIVVLATDEGPGIANIELALQDGYSTARSLGLGLPGVRRLMDEMEIESALGAGTKVKATKWAR